MIEITKEGRQNKLNPIYILNIDRKDIKCEEKWEENQKPKEYIHTHTH